MFHLLKVPERFLSSNSRRRLIPSVRVRSNLNGDPVNEFVMVDDFSPLRGAVYDASRMSLRAQLGLGYRLEPCSLGQTENDPNVLYSLVQRYREHFDQALSGRAVSSVPPVEDLPSSSPSEV